jgi:hypothetical protein
LIGLELGNRIGTKTGERGELLGGLVLIAVGIAVARYDTKLWMRDLMEGAAYLPK